MWIQCMDKYNILEPRVVKYRNFKLLNMPKTILSFTNAIVKKTYGLYNNSIIL